MENSANQWVSSFYFETAFYHDHNIIYIFLWLVKNCFKKKNSDQSSFNDNPKSFIILSPTYLMSYLVGLFMNVLYSNR